MPGLEGAGLGAEGEPEHGQGWEMCESFCHAAFLSCFSKKKKKTIYIYIYIQKPKCQMQCSMFAVPWCPASRQTGD